MSDKKKIMKTLNGYTVYDEDAHRRIDSLAGSAPGLVFDTVADMEAYVAEHSAELKVGQNLYIREVDVPDYWWDGTAVQELETKVDLSGYAKQEDVDRLSEAIASLGDTLTEPAEDDIPKVFFGGALQQTKNEAVVPFSYRSKTLSFDCYAEIKAQGNSTLSWPKKNQTVKLYADAECTEKLKIDFKGWGKQNKFVIKANWRDLTHVRDIVSVRLEGDCLRSNPDHDTFPELLKTSPNMGGIDGFPVVVYAAGVYQGRYMWNIPKDKWMTNMDDELDEHCILCSEDYKSSLFRAAANINGSDWTDEIHDTVPDSIKIRWNEVISFVMNSSDDEFVANLDSYIKVSTLIDRHLMGLLSCDFDGYGKNQLYITYDGQQWYADRYDKDGTWGNYWTGDSMLPSDYGREQYEDFTSTQSDGSGNLLFIRLEKLFWAELQTRWAELRVNELSIPNIINRFRELYDITPPYLIEEDYASTTANGAFTGIPNKTTCTIQQIQKFVVERHAWTDAYVAGLTPEIEVPCTGISLDKTSLSFTESGNQTLTATVTPTDTTDTVVWSSSDSSIASVSGGVVTAKANGSATITATCGGYSDTCTVEVSGIVSLGWSATPTYAISSSDGSVGSGDSYVSDFIDAEAGVMYELSNTTGTYTYLKIALYDENKNFIALISNSSNKPTVSCYAGDADFGSTRYMKLQAFPNNSNANANPQEQLSLTTVERTWSNVRIYDINKDTGVININNTGDYPAFATLKPIEVEGGATYTFTCTGSMYPKIAEYDENMNFIKCTQIKNDAVTATVEETTKYVRTFCSKDIGAGQSVDTLCTFVKN